MIRSKEDENEVGEDKEEEEEEKKHYTLIHVTSFGRFIELL